MSDAGRRNLVRSIDDTSRPGDGKLTLAFGMIALALLMFGLAVASFG